MVSAFFAEGSTVGCMTKALERFWDRRAGAQRIRIAASKRIRQPRPSDPVRIFSEKIESLLQMCGSSGFSDPTVRGRQG
jgi:hypothetical protein